MAYLLQWVLIYSFGINIELGMEPKSIPHTGNLHKLHFRKSVCLRSRDTKVKIELMPLNFFKTNYKYKFYTKFMRTDPEHIQNYTFCFPAERIPWSTKVKCMKILKYLDWDSIIRICAKCAQITTRCTNQK